VFERSDVPAGTGVIPARWDHVLQTPLNTRLENAHGVTISTIEHVMAALAGCGIHNARVSLNGPEVPIMDGSSAAFVREFVAAGLARLNAPLYVMQMVQDVEVTRGDATARLSPVDHSGDGLKIDFAIDFEDRAIGQQQKSLTMANGAFVRELCDSRTFCRKIDVDTLRANGLALGGTYLNAVVVEGAEVLSPGGLRHADEAVRHKMLDALGDLYTAGAPILGRYTGVRAGHALTNALLRQVMSQPDSYKWVRADAQIAARLPGVGVSPADLMAVA
jgi:UDP-3-O-[3-hydroxymyristoyl] N-acetylglucosamine deacetylase